MTGHWVDGIHVAGINLPRRSSEWSLRLSVRSAIALARENGWRTIALPLIRAGFGGGRNARQRIARELRGPEFDGTASVVR